MFQKNFNFDLLQSFPTEYSIWLDRLVLHVTKNIKRIFVHQKKRMRLLIFSDYHEHTSPFFKYLKVLKLQDIQFNILKLVYFSFNDQLPLQIKNIFIQNE